MNAARERAFLKALRETGNQTLAAERARVSRSWVVLHRKEHPEFDAEVRAAVAEAEAALERLESDGGVRPATGWGYLDGVELVVRGARGPVPVDRARDRPGDPAGAASGDGRGKRRRVQIARARVNEISPRVERRFLAVLAATCNVRAAYTAAGVSKGAIYTHRGRWPGFARRWAEALEIGYDQVESGLIERASNLFAPDEFPIADDVPPMTVADAIQLLHMHKFQVHGIGGRPGREPVLEPPIEEVTEEILHRIAVLRRVGERGAAATARAQREWAARRPD